MPLTFVQQIEAVARRIERRRWAAAACWAFAAIAAAMLALIAADWLLGVYHVAGRVVLTVLLVVALVVVLRRARRATRGRTNPLDVAFELERRHPEHRSLLASGLEFSADEGDDPTAGSVDLRRAVVLRAALAAESIDVEAASPRTPLRRAAVAALAAAAMLAIPAAVAPQGFATGVVRLLNPLGDAEWPRRHDLAFVDPPKLIASGKDFQAVLRDRRGRLPDAVTVDYRTRQHGRRHVQSQTYATDGDAVSVRWAKVQESFEFRASGGDHQSMPWRRVETAPAPQIESLQATVYPPGYTGLPVEAIDEPIRVIAGSAIELRGRTNLPIKAGELRADGQPPVALHVRDDGLAFDVAPGSWGASASGEWTFSFTTPKGMTAEADRRLRVDVSLDRPPTVEIVQPVEDLWVLPGATIELVVEANDDLAVDTVRVAIVHFGQETDDVPATIVELLDSPEPPKPGLRSLSHSLELSETTFPAGTTWEVRAHATDYAGQEGSSVRPLLLHVIAQDEFLRRMDALQTRLTGAVERALAEQADARRRVEAWQTATARPAEAGEALAALSRQRQVASALAEGPDAAIELGQRLGAEHVRNKWPDIESQARVERIVASLGKLVDGPLPDIEAGLTSVARAAQTSTESSPQPLSDTDRQRLGEVQNDQNAVIEALEAALRELAEWNELRQFQRDLSELKAEQALLREQTEREARAALEGNEEDAKRQAAGGQQAATAQRGLAARLGSMLARMRQAAEALAEAKPADAARLDFAVAAAEKNRMQSAMHKAAEQLAAQRLGQAAASQRKAEGQLERLVDELTSSGRRQTDGRAGATPPGAQDAKAGDATTQASGKTDQGQMGSSETAAPADRAAIGKLVKDVWGRLPERQREELLQPLSEEFLPEYAADIEEYFRVLAESPYGSAAKIKP